MSHLVFVYGADTTEQRRLEDELRQTEKMAALGKLSAGLAHELNNPSAAAGRAASQILEAVNLLQQATAAMAKIGLSADEWDGVEIWEKSVRDRHRASLPLSPMDMSDREELLLDLLESLQFPAPWEAAPVLSGAGFTTDDVADLKTIVREPAVNAVLVRTCRTLTVDDLADVLARSAESISTLIGAVKSYSYMDRAPVQNADIHRGLEDTITILHHKLKNGIVVVREYDRSIPLIQINGSELNQVWTNLIDNAADSMNQKGTLTIRTSQTPDSVAVEIEDDGPGIPEEVKNRLFEPFFTTKDVGQGTGLGLDIAKRIVTGRSGGQISFTSHPGRTVFVVQLPMRPAERTDDVKAYEARGNIRSPEAGINVRDAV
ncbi:MAG: histidine kinase [Spirochaetales bacterium]|nr:MAG: histidine kinase [Spirochaetales bacterium]